MKQRIYDYQEKIHRPMDLNNIRKRLEYSYYWWETDLLEDIKLICENCKTYNSPDLPGETAARGAAKCCQGKASLQSWSVSPSRAQISCPQGLGVDLTPLDYEIGRRHSQSLLRFLRAKRDSWPFNDSQYWAKFGEDLEYDHYDVSLARGMSDMLVAGKQCEGWD
ncbi:GL24240 [Drosophila persimilis]|uniref:GL24240 n=1 Tax=Drosophila persimilis TaxID=7234 RepID=B4G4U3_DROPE|nr:GL24240 [Drosophila persimilis]